MIDNRVFWGLAALYNLPDLFFAIAYYVGIKTGELEVTPSEDWHQLVWDSFLACFNGVALVAIVVFLIKVAKYLKRKNS